MFKKLMVTVVAVGLLLGNLQARSLRDVLGRKLDQVNNARLLNLNDKGITEITEEEGQQLAKSYPSLENLQLSHNQLSFLPMSIGKMTKLTDLWLDINQLHHLPDSIGNLTKLEALDLTGNRLSTLPASIRNMTKLQLLELDHNKLNQYEIAKVKAAFPEVSIDVRSQQPASMKLKPNYPKDIPEGTSCSICLESEGLDYKTSCGHYFHASELSDWIKGKEEPLCPVCRQNIFTGTPSRPASPKTAMRRVRMRQGRRLASRA